MGITSPWSPATTSASYNAGTRALGGLQMVGSGQLQMAIAQQVIERVEWRAYALGPDRERGKSISVRR